MIELETRGDVRVIHWRDGENRFNRASVTAWHETLDELEAVTDRLALVATGEGKFFSNGLDLDSFGGDPSAAGEVIEGVHRLLGRLLVFPAYTVAALNGHAFAAGAMLTTTFDRRLMREDRGYWCLPEVDLGLPLTEAMVAAVTARLPTGTILEAMNSGHRYPAAEALAAGLVEGTASEEDLLDRAVGTAAALAAKDRSVIATHKRLVLGPAARACGWEA